MRISDWSSDVCSSDLARLLPAAAVAGDREAVGLVAYLLDQLQAGGCSTWMQLPGRLPVDARQQQGFVAGPARLALGHADQHRAVDAQVGQDRKSTRLNSSH